MFKETYPSTPGMDVFVYDVLLARMNKTGGNILPISGSALATLTSRTKPDD